MESHEQLKHLLNTKGCAQCLGELLTSYYRPYGKLWLGAPCY